jgi:hypothetical protein
MSAARGGSVPLLHTPLKHAVRATARVLTPPPAPPEIAHVCPFLQDDAPRAGDTLAGKDFITPCGISLAPNAHLGASVYHLFQHLLDFFHLSLDIAPANSNLALPKCLRKHWVNYLIVHAVSIQVNSGLESPFLMTETHE